MRFHISDWTLALEVRHWWLSLYLDPRRWAFAFHREAPCCKWWLLVGPLELNRIWTDQDTYPNQEDEL